MYEPELSESRDQANQAQPDAADRSQAAWLSRAGMGEPIGLSKRKRATNIRRALDAAESAYWDRRYAEWLLFEEMLRR